MTLGQRSRGTLGEGDTLAAANVTPRVQLDQFLDTFNPSARTSMRRLLSGISGAFDGRSADLSNSIGDVAPTTRNAADVLKIVDGQRPQLGSLINDSGDVFSALGERHGAVQRMLTAADDVLTATARRDRELTRAVRAMPGFLSHLQSTSGKVAGVSRELTATLRAVQAASPSVAPALRIIKRDAPEFRRLFEDVPATATAARRGLPAAERLAKASLPALRATYPALRHAIPSLSLFSANAKELVAVMANLGNALNGRLLGPGSLELPNAMATLFVSNEGVLGYRKRLPTNRLNPYIRPGGLGEMQRRGHLLAYDCRNLNNPLLVPPVGAAPPCVEQGPWEFDGKTAYFPNLAPAAP